MNIKGDYKNSVFLLGGHDLEMIEIAKILKTHEIRFYDRDLKWDTALLSKYSDVLNDHDSFIGIELRSDIPSPAHYQNLDHHNENIDQPSVLEQIAHLLNINLTRHQQLIAANDSGYIPGMKKIGATDSEIAEIRFLDKQAQRVTEEDEFLAQKSIRENQKVENDIVFINSLTPRFSTITDLLYPFGRLLITYQNQLTYYGYGVYLLVEKFHEYILAKRVFHGGGDNGYFSISDDFGTTAELEAFKKELISIIMSHFSYHIFMFPFTWKNNCKIKTDKNDIFDALINGLNGAEKKWNPIQRDGVDIYNEERYFHEFAHPVIFGKIPSDNPNPDKNYRLAAQYEYNLNNSKWFYTIVVNKREKLKETEQLFIDELPKPPLKYKYNEEPYNLNIEKVTLDLYRSGIGIFSFHLKNYTHKNPEDILIINQFGRRVYPPFLDKHFRDFDMDLTDYLQGTQLRELPLEINISTTKDGKEYKFGESFGRWSGKLVQDISDFQLPGHIAGFFPSNISDIMKITPILDDRMFVICWYGSHQLTYDYRKGKPISKCEKDKYKYKVSDICRRTPGGYEVSGNYRNELQHRSVALNQTHNSYGYAENDFWYQYVFVDGYSPSSANYLLRVEQIEKHTYARWVENNTLYGITRYSFVCITEPMNKLTKPFPNAGFIPDHINNIYYRMVMLVLVQRAMILDFSEKISKIFLPESYEDQEIIKNAAKTYEEYRDFINNYFYREITTQEQGIEIYDLLQEHFRVNKQAKELENEFVEMQRYVEILNAKFSASRMKAFTIIAGIFVVPTFIFGLLNNSSFSKLGKISPSEFVGSGFCWNCIYTPVSIAGIAYFFINAILQWNHRGSSDRRKLYLIFTIGLFLIFLLTHNIIIGWLTLLVYISALVIMVCVTYQKSVINNNSRNDT